MKPNPMKNLFFALLVLSLLFAGCSSVNPRYISAPSVTNTTFFREKGDMKFSMSVAANPGFIEKYDYSENGNDYSQTRRAVRGMDGQAAFAITNNFMIAVDGFYRTEEDRFRKDDLNNANDKSTIDYDRRMLNGALGFYAPLGTSQKAYFNFLGGIGVGKVRSDYKGYLNSTVKTTRFHNADLFKINLSPSFNFFFTEYFRMAVAPRFSFLKFNNIQTNYTPEELKTTQFEALDGHYLPLFEPSISLQAGFPGADWLKFDIGFHFSSNPDIGAYNLRSRNFLGSLGLSIYPFDYRHTRR